MCFFSISSGNRKRKPIAYHDVSKLKKEEKASKKHWHGEKKYTKNNLVAVMENGSNFYILYTSYESHASSVWWQVATALFLCCCFFRQEMLYAIASN